MVLAGGDAGLRLGEIIALEWRDIDLAARRLTVERSDWQGHVTVPKGGRSRQLPMTQRLTAALKAARHLRGERVLCLPDGSPIRSDRVIKAVRGAQRVAGIEQGVHILRGHVLFRVSRLCRYGGRVAARALSTSERSTKAASEAKPPTRGVGIVGTRQGIRTIGVASAQTISPERTEWIELAKREPPSPLRGYGAQGGMK